MSAPRTTITTLDDLAGQGLVSKQDARALEPVVSRYALAITPAMTDLIDATDAHDPIARQFVPDPAELTTTPDERADPIGDDTHSPVEGVVHRHTDRVLLKIVDVCAVYCRFCFRREMIGPGGEGMLSEAAFEAALSYIADNRQIWEVILTGGDPFVLSPRRIAHITQKLAAIDHIKVVRWHTRAPVVAPEKVDDALVAALRAPGIATYVVVHTNHARELTSAAIRACDLMIDAGIPLLSQSVLLAGVNDDLDTLMALMRALVAARIKPYYLHHGDLAPGTAHFRTPISKGRGLMAALRAQASGLCQPTYVLDIPGGYGKVSLGGDNLTACAAGYDGAERYSVQDAAGRTHNYPSADKTEGTFS